MQHKHHKQGQVVKFWTSCWVLVWYPGKRSLHILHLIKMVLLLLSKQKKHFPHHPEKRVSSVNKTIQLYCVQCLEMEIIIVLILQHRLGWWWSNITMLLSQSLIRSSSPHIWSRQNGQNYLVQAKPSRVFSEYQFSQESSIFAEW